MPLDVHIVMSPTYSRATDEYTGFGFAVHEHECVFETETINANAYPQIWKMHDYYEDAFFAGDDLCQLILESEQTLPFFITNGQTYDALTSFHTLCAHAQKQGRAIHLLAD